MTPLETRIKEALEELEQSDLPRELWPMVLTALLEARMKHLQ